MNLIAGFNLNPAKERLERGVSLEQLIRGVISLDEKTDNMVHDKESSIEAEKSALQKHFTEMEAEEREGSKDAAKAGYDKIYNEAMEVVDEIRKANHEKLDEVGAVYKEHKKELVEQAFQLLDL